MPISYPGLPKPEPIRPEPSRSQPPPILPTFIQRGDDPRRSDPYDRLYQARILFLATSLDDDAANDIIARLIDLDGADHDRGITIRINSAGGSFTAMLAVHDAIGHIESPVRTVCQGQADGPAAVLLAAGAPGRRFVLPTAHVVLREPTVERVDGPYPPDVRIELDKINWMRQAVEDILAERTGRPADEIRRDLERPKLLTAEQAIEYGIADALLP